MVGHQVLVLAIVVRIHVPEHCFILQSAYARLQQGQKRSKSLVMEGPFPPKTRELKKYIFLYKIATRPKQKEWL